MEDAKTGLIVNQYANAEVRRVYGQKQQENENTWRRKEKEEAGKSKEKARDREAPRMS